MQTTGMVQITCTLEKLILFQIPSYFTKFHAPKTRLYISMIYYGNDEISTGTLSGILAMKQCSQK